MAIRSLWTMVAVVVWCGAAMVVVWADDAAPAPAGNASQSTSPERLSARSLDGQAVAFADLLGRDGKAVCFTFLHPACPLAQRYGPVLAELADEFDPQGIRFGGFLASRCEGRETERDGQSGKFQPRLGLRRPLAEGHQDWPLLLQRQGRHAPSSGQQPALPGHRTSGHPRA